MKSSIDRAGEPTQLRVPGNREFCAGRARRRGREALWARQVFTLISTALALRERGWLFPTGKDSVSGLWPGSLTPPTHHTPRERCAGPSPRGRRIWGHLLPTCQGLLPPMSWPFAVLRFPQKPQLREESLQGLAEKQQPHEGACSGKNKAPSLEALQLLREHLGH